MKILLTGANGQLGWELRRTLSCLGDVIPADRKALDLTQTRAIRQKILEHTPDWIVNAAAFTAVDRAEDEQEACALVNTEAPRILARTAQELGIPLLHYSTDYVFDGHGAKPFTEEDAPAPLNVYGRTKRDGEVAVQQECVRHLVFRTSWVYSQRGSNFLLKIRERANQAGPGGEVQVVNDQFGAPTWARHLAEATALIMARLTGPWCAKPDSGISGPWGVYHMTNRGETSWFGFAEALLSGSHPGVRVLPVPSESFPTRAQRPHNSRLSCDKLAHVFGIRLPLWHDALDQADERLNLPTGSWKVEDLGWPHSSLRHLTSQRFCERIEGLINDSSEDEHGGVDHGKGA
jgi:dTDP-4-dehydrorhamnose reductase